MRRRGLLLVAFLALMVLAVIPLRTRLLNALLYFPSRETFEQPEGLPVEDVVFSTEDGEELHAWWLPATEEPARGHVLYCHGNAGNVTSRLFKIRLLSEAGFDTLLFDYRGYGRSSGSPTEEGTYRDARAALEALMARPGVDPRRILFLGESLGGGVAVELAVRTPPWGLVLQSTFTSVRSMARQHYPFVPGILVPDAYPSISRLPDLSCPVLVVHGDRDRIIPVSEGRALFEAAPEPRQLRILEGVGHNDVASAAGDEFMEILKAWVAQLPSASGG